MSNSDKGNIYKELQKFVGKTVRFLAVKDREWNDVTIVRLEEYMLVVDAEGGFRSYINLYELPLEQFTIKVKENDIQ